MQKNNFIPPASPLNAAWLYKNLTSEIKLLNDKINGHKASYNEKEVAKQKRKELSLKAEYYKTYYNPGIFAFHFNSLKHS